MNDLPFETVDIICSFLKNDDFTHFTKTCKMYRSDELVHQHSKFLIHNFYSYPNLEDAYKDLQFVGTYIEIYKKIVNKIRNKKYNDLEWYSRNPKTFALYSDSHNRCLIILLRQYIGKYQFANNRELEYLHIVEYMLNIIKLNKRSEIIIKKDPLILMTKNILNNIQFVKFNYTLFHNKCTEYILESNQFTRMTSLYPILKDIRNFKAITN